MNRTCTLVIFLGAASMATAALAHQEHDPPPPATVVVPDADAPKAQHGGQLLVLDASDGTRVEALFSASGVELWFFDKAMKPVVPPATAKLTLTVGKGVRKLEAKLDEKKPDRLAIESVLPAEAKVALFIEATMNGKKRSVRVQRELPKVTPVAPAAPTTTP